ncbi:hypothetical protein AcV5_009045 [Taiwanofungus camphoratus]|nr:hypothetical protein AcV5_009045 [Antrodia cinnamomea]
MSSEGSSSGEDNSSLTRTHEGDTGGNIAAQAPTNWPPPELLIPAGDVKRTRVVQTAGALHSPMSPNSSTTPGTSTQRFRRTVHRVMAMRRASLLMTPGRIGAEPGIDPRRAATNDQYRHIRQQCVIELTDYSITNCSAGRMGNREFIDLLNDPGASRRETWVRVRWINVGGISWDVMSALARRYDMHPLAIEDVLHQHRHARSKADYYPQHLFLRILCHRLASHNDPSSPQSSISHLPLPRSDSPEPMGEDDVQKDTDGDTSHELDDERTVFGGTSRFSTKRRWNSLRRDLDAVVEAEAETKTVPLSWSASLLNHTRRKASNSRNLKLVHELKRGERVNVKIHPMCIFLFRDGTVISISEDTNLDFTAPIQARLRQPDTGLRKTADSSLLVQSLIDLVVDQALEVVEEYQGRILKLEQAVLLRPKMKTVTSLHMLQEDLILHKRTLEPIKTLIYGLRRYDVDRATALVERLNPLAKPQGYMSDKARIYLADVYDHIEYILMSLDMFAGISDNLINYTCNMVSYQMNDVMRRLTIATIIFLPLTFLTGYFGMNFVNMWSVHNANHSDLLFWEIALPVMAVVVPIFIWPDLRHMVHYLQKQLVKRKVKKTFRHKYH